MFYADPLELASLTSLKLFCKKINPVPKSNGYKRTISKVNHFSSD